MESTQPGLYARTAFRPWPAGNSVAALPAIPTVFVVNDDAGVRQSVAAIAGRAGWHMEIVASASELLGQADASAPSCVILDVELPNANGLEVQQRLADRPEIPVIFVSNCGDVRTAVRAMKRGAVEFLVKPLAAELLFSALQHAIDRSRAAIARRIELEATRARYASLTGRERDVMALVVCGRPNKHAAAELGISVITVKAHRGQMMRKMGARSVPDLVNMAATLFSAA